MDVWVENIKVNYTVRVLVLVWAKININLIQNQILSFILKVISIRVNFKIGNLVLFQYLASLNASVADFQIKRE